MTDMHHADILVIHGPNLNMLGKREPEVYGSTTLEEINAKLIEVGNSMGLVIKTYQSNHEGQIVDRIQQAVGRIRGVIINPAAFTHTSVAIRDALLLLDVPIVEIHLSNIYKREAFRHKSVVADIAAAQISGFGAIGYTLALKGISSII
jgi:3-dehydroquinate dehydratase-2